MERNSPESLAGSGNISIAAAAAAGCVAGLARATPFRIWATCSRRFRAPIGLSDDESAKYLYLFAFEHGIHGAIFPAYQCLSSGSDIPTKSVDPHRVLFTFAWRTKDVAFFRPSVLAPSIFDAGAGGGGEYGMSPFSLLQICAASPSGSFS